MTHALVLIDRGLGHVHRWKPSCSCGLWVGAQRRRKQEAVKQYRVHRTTLRPAQRTRGYKPRLPTPAHLLPIELAPAVVSFS